VSGQHYSKGKKTDTHWAGPLSQSAGGGEKKNLLSLSLLGIETRSFSLVTALSFPGSRKKIPLTQLTG